MPVTKVSFSRSDAYMSVTGQEYDEVTTGGSEGMRRSHYRGRCVREHGYKRRSSALA
jgi:hypothetical protein